MIELGNLTRRPRFVTGVATLLASAPLAVPLHAEDDRPRDQIQQQLEQTKKQLQSTRAREQGLSENVGALTVERARLNAELIRAARIVQESESRLSSVEDRLEQLGLQEKAIRTSISDRHEAIAQLLAAMQRMGRQPPPALITRRDDNLKTVRSAMLLATVFPELRYQADNLTRELDSLVQVERATREERDAAQQATAALSEERGKIDSLLAAKQQRLTADEAELASLRDDANKQAQTVSSLEDLIKRQDAAVAKAERVRYEAELAAEKERVRQAALAVPPNETVVELKPGTKVAFVSPDRMKPALPFDKAKGSLALPASGRTLKRYGDTEGGGGAAKGVSLETRDGARITSPSDGWVVYSGPFRSYGQLLIINAGGGYHILLAGMKQIDVAQGQFVLAGEPVAVMGSSASASETGNGSQRPILYVEFRKDGRAIDPGPWWAETSEKAQG